MRKTLSLAAIAVIAALGLMLLSTGAQSPTARWILPVADGGEQPSPPSVHGYIAAVSEKRVTVVADERDAKTRNSVSFQLMPKTQFFTAYGGLCQQSDLEAGQYVWAWYITADPKRAGSPPRAAVVMLWSQDPADKPSQKTRFSFDQRK